MTQKPVITPSQFFKYAVSPHWIWYDLNGDPSKKGEVPEFTQKLIEEGVLHEENYVKDLKFDAIPENLSEKNKLKETLQLMKSGADLIYQGMIETDAGTAIYRGQPDLLEKRPGKSNFGDYFYTPIEIKNSTKCEKAEYRFQLTFYAFILEKLQGLFPAEGGFINKKQVRLVYPFKEKDKVATLERADTILQIINGKEPPLKITSISKSSPWFDELLKTAKEKNDISLIYKLDSRAIENLKEIDIKTVADMAGVDVDSLPKISYAGPETLARAKEQAKSLLGNKVIPLSKPAIPDAKVKIYFDIEGDPFLKVEYLFGFWIAEEGEEPYFKYFIAEQPEDEEKMWHEFLEWVNVLPYDDYRVYHYADYERQKLIKLSENYGGSDQLNAFIGKLVDLAKIVQESVILPLYFYSIKDIAKSPFLGYKWRHEKAGGAQSIFWYEKWLEAGDKSVLQDIINYNEDDVVATEFLHEWLLRL